jgi:hypothetical protein
VSQYGSRLNRKRQRGKEWPVIPVVTLFLLGNFEGALDKMGIPVDYPLFGIPISLDFITTTLITFTLLALLFRRLGRSMQRKREMEADLKSDPTPTIREGLMSGQAQKRRTNRAFKSLHKPLTYLGVERTLFYFVCVGAVGAFNIFNSILAGLAVFIGGFAFGHWVTSSDPAFLRILAKSEKYRLRYDAAKQSVPCMEVV